MKNTLCISLLLLSSWTHAQKKFEIITCPNLGEQFEVIYTNSPLTPGNKALAIEIRSVSGKIQEYKYVFSSLEKDMLPTSSKNSFLFDRNSGERFKKDDEFNLIVEPVYPNSENLDTRGRCTRLEIPIPILKNKRPDAQIPSYETSMIVSGVEKEMSIDGKELINDDDYQDGKWFFIKKDPGFDINSNTGEVVFKHDGKLTDESKKIYESQIAYQDWNKEDTTSNIRIEITRDNIPPTLSNAVLGSFVEGISKSEGNIYAEDIISGSAINVRLIGHKTLTGSVTSTVFNARIQEKKLVWKPPYDVVPDGNATREVVFLMEPIVEGVEVNPSTLKVTVKSRTDSLTQIILDETFKKYDEANKEFRDLIKRPSCIMAYTITYLDKKDINLGLIKTTYETLDDVGLNLPSQVIPFVNVALSIVEGINKSKRKKIEAIIKDWTEVVAPLIKTSGELRTSLLEATSNNFMDKFTSKSQADDLKRKADDYLTSVQGISNEVFKIESIISLVNSDKQRKLITEKCNN